MQIIFATIIAVSQILSGNADCQVSTACDTNSSEASLIASAVSNQECENSTGLSSISVQAREHALAAKRFVEADDFDNARHEVAQALKLASRLDEGASSCDKATVASIDCAKHANAESVIPSVVEMHGDLFSTGHQSSIVPFGNVLGSLVPLAASFDIQRSAVRSSKETAKDFIELADWYMERNQPRLAISMLEDAVSKLPYDTAACDAKTSECAINVPQVAKAETEEWLAPLKSTESALTQFPNMQSLLTAWLQEENEEISVPLVEVNGIEPMTSSLPASICKRLNSVTRLFQR